MAEKITLFELDIDIEASKRDLEETRLAVNELKKGLKELSDAEKENNKQLEEQRKKLDQLQSAKKKDVKAITETQANIDKLLTKRTQLNSAIVDQTTVLKTNQTQLRQNQKVIQDTIAASDGFNREIEEEKIRLQLLNAERKKTIKAGIQLANEKKELTILQNKNNRSEAENIRLNSLLVKQRKNLVVNSAATRKEYNQLTKQILQNNNALKQSDKSIGRFQRNVGNYATALRGLVPALGLTGAIVQVQQLLSKSTEAYKAQTVVVSNLTTILRERTSATDAEINSILNLTSAQQQLGVIGDEIQIAGAQQIATFVTETKTVETLIPALNNLLAQRKGVNATQQDAVTIGNLFGKVLQGEVASLKKVGISFNEAQKEVLKFGTENEKAAILAQVITDNVGELNQELASTDIGELKNLENQLGDIEEAIGEEILPALVEWKNLQLEILQGIQNLRKGYDVISFEQAKVRVQEFVDQQKLNDAEEKRLAFQRRFLEIEKEANEIQKFLIKNKDRLSDFDDEELKALREKGAILIEEKKLLIELGKQGFIDAEFRTKQTNKRKKDTKDISDAEKRAIERRQKELERAREKERREEEKRRQEIERQRQADLQALIKAEEQKRDIIARLKQEQIDQEKEKEILDEQNRIEVLKTNLLGELEAERQFLELKRNQEIAFAESIGADTTLIEQRYRNARIELARAETNAKLDLAAGFFANVATIAGEGTAIAKAAGVAETTINTYKAAQGAFSALAPIPVVGPALGAVAAAAAVATGIRNVRKILAVDSGLPGGGSVSASTPSASSAASVPRTNTQASLIAPEINRGIISRDIPNINNIQNQPQTAVIVDEVTAKQNNQKANSTTSVI